MEQRRFDDLAKTLASPVSRRTAVMAAVAVLFGGMLPISRAQAQEKSECEERGYECCHVLRCNLPNGALSCPGSLVCCQSCGRP